MKEKAALITICVGIYNGEHYLAECVDSILKQDYRNLEIILVDDGSTDHSGHIADTFAAGDHRVKVLHQKNAGVSVARNAAMDIANGAYICFVDQDDCLAPDYVSYFYGLILENNAEIAITPSVREFTSFTQQRVEKEASDKVEVWTGTKAASEMLYYNVVIAPWNKIISRDLITRNNLRFHPDFFSGEGFSFSVDCFQRAAVVAVGHRKVYEYRVDNPNSGMTKFSMEVLNSSIGAQKFIRSNLAEKTPELLRACRYANWHTHCDCFNTMIGCRVAHKYKEVYKKIRKVCQREALQVLKAPVPVKEKCKGMMYAISPFLAARIVNHFRLRKFTIQTEKDI